MGLKREKGRANDVKLRKRVPNVPRTDLLKELDINLTCSMLYISEKLQNNFKIWYMYTESSITTCKMQRGVSWGNFKILRKISWYYEAMKWLQDLEDLR